MSETGAENESLIALGSATVELLTITRGTRLLFEQVLEDIQPRISQEDYAKLQDILRVSQSSEVKAQKAAHLVRVMRFGPEDTLLVETES